MLKRFPNKKDAGKPSPEKHSSDVGISLHFYRLYFKGLVRDNSLAVFGVAICGQKDNLLFQLNGPVHGSNVTVLEAELSALKQGLTQALSLGITHISIYCDYYPIYQLISGRSVPREKKTALLMNNIKLIRKQFKSSFSIYKVGNNFRYANKLAKETIITEISKPVDPPHLAMGIRQGSCSICLDDNIHANKMFTIDKCCHRFCEECVKRHLEVKLLEGSVIRCPHNRCKSKLTWRSCVNLLTPKLRKMWLQRIKEDSIPVTERLYCPNARCLAFMSVKELYKSTKNAGGRRLCLQCGHLFSIDRKVLRHSNLSCKDSKNVDLPMEDVQRTSQQLTENQIVMESVVSVISKPMHPAQKKTCRICFEDDLEVEQMFSVALCPHEFCVKCVKQHIEMSILEGSVLKCPHYGCKSNLTLGRYANLLTPKLIEMWERRIKEDSIPVCARVYCPIPSCSALMSKTELSKSTKETEVRKCCVKCGEPFCINCKVPWHNDLSCNDYKRLGPNPTADDIKLIVLANKKLWRQCGNCQHMIERSKGCSVLTCRCGYRFCYTCGAKWKPSGHCCHPAEVIDIVYGFCFLLVVLFSFIILYYYLE